MFVFTIRRNKRNVKLWHKKSLLICMISALDCTEKYGIGNINYIFSTLDM